MRNYAMKMAGMAILALSIAPIAFADSTLFYGGDPGSGFTWSGVSGGLTALSYDNFTVPAGGWTINSLGGHFVSLGAGPGTLGYEIRSGVSSGDGGTLVASGSGIPTVAADAFPFIGYENYFVEITGLSVGLVPGNYWLSLSWNNGQATTGGPYIQSTAGTNGVGAPLSDGNAFFDGFGYNFARTEDAFGYPQDFSYRIGGPSGAPGVPEIDTSAIHGALSLLGGVLLVGLGGRRA